MENFIPVKLRIITQEPVPQGALKTSESQGGGQYICGFGEGNTCNQAHILVEGFCWSKGTDILMVVNGFSAFLSMGR